MAIFDCLLQDVEEPILQMHEMAITALQEQGLDYWSSRSDAHHDNSLTCNTVIFSTPIDAQLVKCNLANELNREYGPTEHIIALDEDISPNTIFGNTAFYCDYVVLEKAKRRVVNQMDRKVHISFNSLPIVGTPLTSNPIEDPTIGYHIKFYDASNLPMPTCRCKIQDMLCELLRCSTCRNRSFLNEKGCCNGSGDEHGPRTTQSLLIGCHCRSPWYSEYDWEEHDRLSGMGDFGCEMHESTVAILFRPQNENTEIVESVANTQHDWNVESFEVPNETFFQFRVGDVSPSFYLHCCFPLALNSELPFKFLQESIVTGQDINPQVGLSLFWMFVYRQNPPRLHMHKKLASLKSTIDAMDENKVKTVHHVCNSSQEIIKFEESNNDHALLNIRGEAIWEACQVTVPDKGPLIEQFAIAEAFSQQNDEEGRNSAEVSEGMVDVLMYREVSPPYLENWRQHFGSIMDHMLTSSAIQAMKQEAISIPQWTPWPEQAHYDIQGGSDWKVFPLCHTFPASDFTKRKWIQSTCSHCPQTVELLCKLGVKLRTALFSRLGPKTLLSPHAGWQDLANHVVRVHIPLLVPPGGYCGTWVDGCAMLHKEGVVQVFDDSKVHRAFNNSSEERLVLIFDLERPPTLPTGTAVGGHTEELDAFINAMT